MNIKRILLICTLFLMTFLIYFFTIDNKINYLSLGDSLAAGQNPYGAIGYGYSDYVDSYLKEKEISKYYTKDFSKSGYRTTDILRDIKDNKELIINERKIAIQEAIHKADIITLSIGANDFFYKLGINNLSVNIDSVQNTYKYIDEIMVDIDTLLLEIKKYNNKDIIIIGYYNPLSSSDRMVKELEPIFIYANDKLLKLTEKHEIYFVPVYEMFKENKDYLPNPLDIHPGNKGYEAVSNEIINIIEEKK